MLVVPKKEEEMQQNLPLQQLHQTRQRVRFRPTARLDQAEAQRDGPPALTRERRWPLASGSQLQVCGG